MAFIDDAESILKKYPYVTHNETGEWGGNCILETAQMLLIKGTLEGLKESDRKRVQDMYSDAMVAPGAINRGSHKPNEPQRHDDYVGLMAIAGILAREVALAVYCRGNNRNWSYRLPGFTGFKEWFNSQFWRMPGVVQTIKMAANKELNAWDKLFLSVRFVSCAFSPSQTTSGRLLAWCMLKLYIFKRCNYWLPNIAIRVFEKDIERRYKNKMGDVFGIYYGFSHIYSKKMWGII